MPGPTRRRFLAGTLGTGTLATAAPSDKPQRNILLVLADQMVPFLTGAYGHPVVRTPNLNRLAARGVRFDAAYSPNPLCAPARACLVTGRHSSAIGVHDNASPLGCDQPTFAHYLNKAGYDTAIAGKMHFVGPDQHHGFRARISRDIYPPDFEWTKPREGKRPRSHARNYLGSTLRIIEPGQQPPRNQELDEEAHRAGLDYLAARGRDGKPFALTVSYNYPHEPFHAPREFWDLYEDADIDVSPYPPGFEQKLSVMDRWLNRHHGADKIDVTEPESRRRLRRAYYALVSYVDHKVGELLDSLERNGFASNTAVLFTADHGDMLTEKGMVQKRCFYEWSARVPMILALPGGRHAGRAERTPVSLIDVAPTLLDLADVQPDPRVPLDGVSLLDLVGRPNPDRAVYSESHSEGVYTTCFMVRRGFWKYVHIHGREAQLFNLDDDPDEWKNLAGRAAHRDEERQLRDMVLQRFDPDAIEHDLRSSIARREVIRDSMRLTRAEWNFQVDPVS